MTVDPQLHLILTAFLVGLSAGSLILSVLVLTKYSGLRKTVQAMSLQAERVLELSDSHDLVRAMKRHVLPPEPLSPALQNAMWSLVREFIIKTEDLETLPLPSASEDVSVGSDLKTRTQEDEPTTEPVPIRLAAKSAPDGESELQSEKQPVQTVLRTFQSTKQHQTEDERRPPTDIAIKTVGDPNAAKAERQRPSPGSNPHEVRERPVSVLGAESASEKQALDVANRLISIGLAGMKALSSEGDFLEFRRVHKPVFFNVDDQGIRSSASAMHFSHQILFGLTDEETGLVGLFLGPGLRAYSQKFANNAEVEQARFAPWFDVTVTGNRPKLIEPAIVKVVDHEATLIRKGKMTI